MAEGDGSTSAGTSVVIRRRLAIFVAAAGVALVVLSHTTGLFRVCAQELATVGGESVVNVCKPLGLPLLISVGLLVLVLLWPDMSELAIPGFVSLKRKVEQQDNRQEELERVVAQVQQSVTQQNVIQVISPDWDQLQKAMQNKEAVLEAGTDLSSKEQSVEEATEVAETVDPQTATLESRLLRAWEELRPFVQPASTPGGRDLWVSLDPDQQTRAREFQFLFREELRYVQAARNSVAHPLHNLAVDDLNQAVKTAERLRTLLLDRFVRPPGE